MAEFGHNAFIGSGVCIDSWGSGPFTITAGGKSWRFEDSERFGPALVKRNGDLLANPYPGERSLFWRAHGLWATQGRRLAEDGTTCIYDVPNLKPTKVRKIGRRYLVVEPGDDDGGIVVVSEPHPTGSGEQ